MGIDRRGFLRTSAVQAAVLGVAATGCARLPGGGGSPFATTHPGAPSVARDHSPFVHGVASGDPLTDRVILWTRVSPFVDRPGEPIETRWWIARDARGQEIVAEGVVEARPETDYTVKVDASGLEPGSDYHYGFATREGESPTGRTRTLSGDDARHVRMAFASCANYPAGFFNGYAALADRDDIDLVLHLGDYLYEYGNGRYGDGTSTGRVPDPMHETLSLEDYRRRHATYKRDVDLAALHARHPMIAVWDDHESANNSWPGGAENHDPETEGEWSVRKLAAIRAYYEWMPIRELPTGLYRQFRIGSLVDLIMLDTRLAGRDAEVRQGDALGAEDPTRTLLGEEQRDWLFSALADSKAADTAWRVIGQQIMVAPVSFDGVDFNPDSWNGYRGTRRRLLDHLDRHDIDNVVFLTGDVHSSWAFDVPPPAGSGSSYDPENGAGSRAVEFVTPAISSPSIGNLDFWEGRREALVDRTPHLRYMNLDDHGFVILDIRPERVRAEYVFTDPPERRSRRAAVGARFEARSGTQHIERLADASGR